MSEPPLPVPFVVFVAFFFFCPVFSIFSNEQIYVYCWSCVLSFLFLTQFLGSLAFPPRPQFPFCLPQQPKALCKGRQDPFLHRCQMLKVLGILEKILTCSFSRAKSFTKTSDKQRAEPPSCCFLAAWHSAHQGHMGTLASREWRPSLAGTSNVRRAALAILQPSTLMPAMTQLV